MNNLFSIPATVPNHNATMMSTQSPADREGSAAKNVALMPKDDLVLQHISLVRFAVHALRASLPAHVDPDELMSAGYVGLVDAAMKFDASMHIQFRSYAQFRIRGAILDSLRTSDWSPRLLRRKGREIAQVMEEMAQRLNRPATEVEVADVMGVSLAEYQQMLFELRSTQVESYCYEGDDEQGWTDCDIADASAPGALASLLECEQRAHMEAAIESLPERERLVITLSYLEELTLREVGLALDLSESRVSQVRTSAVLRLRAALAPISRMNVGDSAPSATRHAARASRSAA